MRLLEESMSERRPCSREVDPRNKRIHLNSEIRVIRQASQFDPPRTCAVGSVAL